WVPPAVTPSSIADAPGSERLISEPRRITGIADEPPAARRPETGFEPLQPSFPDHRADPTALDEAFRRLEQGFRRRPQLVRFHVAEAEPAVDGLRERVRLEPRK